MKQKEKTIKKWIHTLDKMKDQMQQMLDEPDDTAMPDISEAYAVIWDYKSGGRPVRAGLSDKFEDPKPAEGVNSTGFSPFDEIMPWGGMHKCICSSPDGSGEDVVVSIPEFYYFAFKDKVNKRWIWAISPTEKEGFEKHPGSGRLVGRYHTSGSPNGARSGSGEKPLARTNWDDFRKYSEAKGDGWGMMDIATWSAIQLLYLIEFADFDAQKCLGSGSKDEEDWKPVKTGGTDSATYHTVKASGTANQYRWIEDPFSNVFDWIDGFAGSGEGCRIGMESGLDMEDMSKTGIRLADDGWIRNFGYSEKAPWLFIPSKSEENTDHVPNYVWSWPSGLYPAFVGGYYYDYANYGFFSFNAYYSASDTYDNLGSRLQKT